MRMNFGLADMPQAPLSVLSEWKRQRVADGTPPLDVSMSTPPYPPALELREFLASQVMSVGPERYTDVEGLPALREAVAAKTGRLYGTQIAPESVLITTGCTEAFAVATMAVASAGDEILLPVPFYFGHDQWLRASGVRPVYLASDESSPDVDAWIGARLSARTRALVLVTPGNPTGQALDPAFIERCAHACRHAGIALILDEAYRDLRADPSPPHALFQDPQWHDTFIQLCSYSKAYSLTGYRVGSVVCGQTVRSRIVQLLEALTICPTHLSQLAVWFGLTHLDAWCGDRSREIALQRALFLDALHHAHTGFDVASSGGGFAYLRHAFRNLDADAVARGLLNQFNVIAMPGSAFGPRQERFLRVSFANLSREQMPELVDRLRRFGSHVQARHADAVLQ